MKPTVDVWVARKAAASLVPSVRSIVTGDAAAIQVWTCALRLPGERRVAMTLTVDEATAKHFARACRLQDIWERRIIPVVLGAATLLLIIGLVNTEFVALLSLIGLAIATGVARLVWTSLPSRHHPRLKGRGTVLIRDVDRQTAQSWIGLNSPDDIWIIE